MIEQLKEKIKLLESEIVCSKYCQENCQPHMHKVHADNIKYCEEIIAIHKDSIKEMELILEI
jgi:hypothetical protein